MAELQRQFIWSYVCKWNWGAWGASDVFFGVLGSHLEAVNSVPLWLQIVPRQRQRKYILPRIFTLSPKFFFLFISLYNSVFLIHMSIMFLYTYINSYEHPRSLHKFYQIDRYVGRKKGKIQRERGDSLSDTFFKISIS